MMKCPFSAPPNRYELIESDSPHMRVATHRLQDADRPFWASAGEESSFAHAAGYLAGTYAPVAGDRLGVGQPNVSDPD